MINVVLKIILAMVLLLTGTFTSNAQSNNNFEFGIKAGGNLTNLKNTNGKHKIGLVGGIFTEYRISKKFSVRSEALFSMQGAKGKGSFETVKLNYINVLPGLAKFHPVESIRIEVGPYGGFLFSKKGGNLNKSDYRKIDYGATLGIGFGITENVELGARYYYGLRDITKTTGEIKNKTIQVALSYSF
ncbi:MAG: hypothetical protein CSA39_04760 [Flavobacteriales bacterium]|nr:MAG: hypothetical protein CSA39_04760 [Flavobacteriales bacterium]